MPKKPQPQGAKERPPSKSTKKPQPRKPTSETPAGSTAASGVGPRVNPYHQQGPTAGPAPAIMSSLRRRTTGGRTKRSLRKLKNRTLKKRH